LLRPNNGVQRFHTASARSGREPPGANKQAALAQG